jgi:nicotinate-nucleotide adenylyltransferase
VLGLVRRLRLVRQATKPGDSARQQLNQPRHAAHAGEQAVMIESVRKQEISRFQQVDLARAEHVLRLDRFSALQPVTARHHVGYAVDPHQAAITGRAETIRSARAMQLGAARERRSTLCDQAVSERLAELTCQQFAVVQELRLAADGDEAERHARYARECPSPATLASPFRGSRLPRSGARRGRQGPRVAGLLAPRETRARMRLGVYGGSFNPVHVAHVLLAAYALSVGRFDRVLVVPVFAHAFDKTLAPFEQRVRMCELAFAPLSGVEISRVEAELPTPSRTLFTLEALSKRYPGAELNLLVGTDVLSEASKWHAFDAVVRLAPLFVVGRAGLSAPDARRVELPQVSSTRVRELLALGAEPSAQAELAELVPASVLEYLRAERLYG